MIRWRSLSIVIADDQKMALLNRRYLRRAGPTDVMSFVYRSGKHPEARYDAEVILNAERAASAGLCYGGISRELALYLAHGCDHLSGNSDDTRRDRSRMRRRELRWLKVATESGLMEGLTQS
jgi:rRNA maturation RNase YbeY